jgi:RimJ/RimL family protein N-acetyltransferase
MDPILIDFPEEFQTERLSVRAPRFGDGAELNAAVRESIENLRKWLPWAQTIPTIEESEANVREARLRFLKRQDLRLHLFLKDTGTLVGSSGLHRIDWGVPRFEIGYWVRNRFEGQGYIQEAVIGITHFAFQVLGARRVEIRVDELNLRSCHIPEKLGFALDGILVNDERNAAGQLRNTRIYSKISIDR